MQESRRGQDETIVIQRDMQCKINLKSHPFTGNVSLCTPANTVNGETHPKPRGIPRRARQCTETYCEKGDKRALELGVALQS